MFYFRQFEIFDPLNGVVNVYKISHLPQIAVRARSILGGGKSHQQIVSAAKRISREIEIYFNEEKYHAISNLKAKLEADGLPLETYFDWDGGTQDNGCWVFKEDLEDDLEMLSPSNCSEVDALKAVIENRDFCFFLPEGAPEPEPNHYPEGKTPELFAVLSLWLLADAIECSRSDAKYSTQNAAANAIKSMDALCYAEHLREIEWFTAHLKEKAGADLASALGRQYSDFERSNSRAKSELARELNKARHAANTKAKEMVVREWAKNPSQFSSAEKAGTHYAQWLISKGTVKSVEPRTVTGWIRNYAKQKGVKFR